MDIEERIRQRNLASLLPSDDEASDSSDDDAKPAIKSSQGKGVAAANKSSGKLAAAEIVLDDDGDDEFGPSTAAASKKAGVGRPRNVKADKEAVGRKRKRGDDVEDLLEGVDDPGMRLLLRLGSGDIDAAAAVDGLSRAQAKEDKRKRSRKHPDSEDEDGSGTLPSLEALPPGVPLGWGRHPQRALRCCRHPRRQCASHGRSGPLRRRLRALWNRGSTTRARSRLQRREPAEWTGQAPAPLRQRVLAEQLLLLLLAGAPRSQ